MEKRKLFTVQIIAIVLILLSVSWESWGADCGQDPPTWHWSYEYGGYTHQCYVLGIWDSAAEALAAANMFEGSNPSGGLCSFYGYAATGGGCYSYYRKPEFWPDGEDPYYYLFAYCTNPGDPPEWFDEGWQGDQDGDGIPDWFDPSINEDDGGWQIDILYKDPDTGEIEGAMIGWENGTKTITGSDDLLADLEDGTPDDYDSQMQIWIGNQYANDADDYMEWLQSFSGADEDTTEAVENALAQGLGSFSVVDIVDEYDAGSGAAAGTETDNELLQNIQNNTSDTADNLALQGNDLRRIAEATEMIAQQALLGTQDVNVTVEGEGGTYEGPSASSIASAIDSNDDSRLSDLNSDASSESSSQLSTINGYDFDTQTSGYQEYGTGELPEENLISDIFDDHLSDNAIQDAIDGTDLTLTNPVCSVDVNIDWISGNQETITLSLCDWESSLEDFGVLLLAITGLTCVGMVIRG